MRNNLLKLTSSDTINAQIQQQEIHRIIQQQQRKKEQISKSSVIPQTFSQKLHHNSSGKRKASAFFIRITKSNQKARRTALSPQATSFNGDLHSQMSYFSVKQRYEKIIDSSFDAELVRQLREELEPLGSARYSDQLERCSDSTSNFFQKVFTRSSKMHRYFQELKRSRRQKMKMSEEIYFR